MQVASIEQLPDSRRAAAIAGVGVFALLHLAGIYWAAHRCYLSLKKIEQKLGLSDDDNDPTI